MSQLDILVPFGLPPKELATDLLRDLSAPAFATLLTRATRHSEHNAPEFARALPHEVWLAEKFGLVAQSTMESSPPVATAAMRLLGIAEEPGQWFIVNPVHIHIARDHLVLTDPRQLALSSTEARALFDAAQVLFQEAGKELVYGDDTTWFARADDWSQLQTSTPDAACGHNIDIWMPSGEGARNWRKLQNDVQMHWFTSEVNAQRETRGLKPVNSIWLWGGSASPAQAASPSFTEVFNLHGWMRAFETIAARQASDADISAIIASSPQRGLLLLDQLLETALNNDWGSWQQRLQELENAWFAPLLAFLKEHRIQQLTLVLTDQASIASFATNRPSLYKFWRRPSLSILTK